MDTGFWIFGKKRMIPAGVVTSVDHEDETVSVGMTKDQIKSAPDYDKQDTYDDRDYDTFGSLLRQLPRVAIPPCITRLVDGAPPRAGLHSVVGATGLEPVASAV